MDTIPQVVEAMQTILNDVADTAARTTGLIRRPTRVKLIGAQFVQTLYSASWPIPMPPAKPWPKPQRRSMSTARPKRSTSA